MSDTIAEVNAAATTLADTGIEVAAKALETATARVPVIGTTILVPLEQEAAKALEAKLPEWIADIERGIAHEFGVFEAWLSAKFGHALPPAIAHLSDADLRELVEAIDNPHFDATDAYATWAGWHAKNVAENAVNLRRAFEARGLK